MSLFACEIAHDEQPIAVATATGGVADFKATLPGMCLVHHQSCQMPTESRSVGTFGRGSQDWNGPFCSTT